MARKQKKYHFIYKTTNLLSGKYYYGMHSTDNMEDGYLGSGRRLKYSLNKYGVENHKREIVEFCDSREKLKEREKEIVNLNEIAKVGCMNLTVGGEGGFTPEQQRENARKSNEKQRILRETNPEWWDNKLKNMSKGQKKSYEDGREKIYFYDWSGKNHSEETKKKIGDTNRIKQRGEKNSQYGTCWITKDGENMKIKKEELLEYTTQGWTRGRK